MDDPLTQAPASAHPLLSQSTPTQPTPLPIPASLPLSAAIQAGSTVPTSFASAQFLRSQHTDGPPLNAVPEYVAPSQVGVPPTGVVSDGRYRVLEDGEELGPADKATTGKGTSAGGIKRKVPVKVVRESEVRQFSVSELKKRGLGRTPSGYCYSARMTMHRPLEEIVAKNSGDDPHPEQPGRIIGIFKQLEEAGLTKRMNRIAVREAVKDEILLVHSEGHWERVRGTGFQTPLYLATCAEYFDRLSLYVNPETAICARLSCGGVIEMCRAVAEGQIRNGFAIVRPPGHHSEPEDAMGFCFFNNCAVAAKWLRTIYNGESPESEGNAIKKVLILDWDVHHGNGTQKAFFDDPNVLFISLHRHDGSFYPGGPDGAAEMVGDGPGKGFSVNIPFPDKGMKDADYIYAFQQVVMPIAYEFAPDFVLVSAGYDAAEGDELGQMKVTPAGFAHMTHMLSVLAQGKLVLALEGGYNVEAISNSAHACVEVLVGDEPRHLALDAASASATTAIHEVKMIQRHHWKCMGEALEATEDLRQAGKVVPVSEILKAHRTYDLYHKYQLYNIEFVPEDLEETFKDQLLCSEDVYTCKTLVLFMHDLGSIKASFSAATLDVHLEKTLLIDTSSRVLDWAMKEQGYGVVDVNFLAHLPISKGQAPDLTRNKEMEKKLALYIWDNIIAIASCDNIILFGSGCGCSALMNIVQNRPAVRQRVKACISVLGFENPPELDASSGVRGWYKENSLVMMPATHPLHDDARKAGKHQKKFGNVHRATAEDESRPLHMLKASLPRIKDFVASKLPAPTPKLSRMDVDGDSA